jgi:hypothetical protein
LDVENADDLPDLTDRPYLFWVRPGKHGYTRSFCVKECPEEGLFSDAFVMMTVAKEQKYQGFRKTQKCGEWKGKEIFASVESTTMASS